MSLTWIDLPAGVWTEVLADAAGPVQIVNRRLRNVDIVLGPSAPVGEVETLVLAGGLTLSLPGLAGETVWARARVGDGRIAVVPVTGPLTAAELRASTLSVAGAASALLNISAATVVKATPGRLVRVSVVTAGIAGGAVHDCATTGAAAAANKVASIANVAGIVDLDWPCATGIVVVPGTSQVLAVSYV